MLTKWPKIEKTFPWPSQFARLADGKTKTVSVYCTFKPVLVVIVLSIICVRFGCYSCKLSFLFCIAGFVYVGTESFSACPEMTSVNVKVPRSVTRP